MPDNLSHVHGDLHTDAVASVVSENNKTVPSKVNEISIFDFQPHTDETINRSDANAEKVIDLQLTQVEQTALKELQNLLSGSSSRSSP